MLCGLTAILVGATACEGTNKAATTPTTAQARPALFTVQRLSAPMSWGAPGNNQMQPVPTNVHPHVTASRAYAAAEEYEGPGNSARPVMILGRYTSPDGVGYSGALVWLAWYRHVSFTVTSPPGPSGEVHSTKTIGDGLTLVDATTGSMISAGSVAPPIP